MENQGVSITRAELLEQAREAPLEPGVYLMKDVEGHILYVGKAKSLKNRLSTYFQKGPHEAPRTEMLVGRIQKFEVILTETESEALILEATLIKKYKPKFNVRLKDDKAYPYIRIQIGDTYPQLEWTRRVKRDGARYFGPFPSGWAAKQIMGLLTETFKLRDCSDNTFRHRSRPCILNQMGKCTGPCVSLVSPAEYREQIDQVIQILEGKSDVLEKQLRKGMKDSSERQEYETAAYYRDQLENLAVVTATQVVDEAGSHRHRDVIAIEREGANAHAVILQVRSGRMLAVKHMHVQNTDESLTDAELLYDFISQFYVLFQKEQEEAAVEGVKIIAPSELLLPIAPQDSTLLEKTLGMTLRVPETEFERRLVQVAKTNAKHSLDQQKKTEGGHGIQALEEIQEKLHLEKIPGRIECYDISNIQGEDAVASRVVFVDGAPDKNLYRRYKIKTVQGSNDFAMMKEVLGRRFANDESLPDLVVVDGGKGQLSQAVAILTELNVQGVDVVGLAKARTESDFRATEVESSMERIFIPGRKNPVPLLPHTRAYKLLTHVRDEAHRFAISYHRFLRDKRSMKSSS